VSEILSSKESNMNGLIKLVEKWAEDRNLIMGATPQAQMLKMVEELGELAGGIARNKRDIIQDSFGDCLVVLIILAKQLDCDLEECLWMAYEEIKDRKGRMINGVFVKEEDLNES